MIAFARAFSRPIMRATSTFKTTTGHATEQHGTGSSAEWRHAIMGIRPVDLCRIVVVATLVAGLVAATFPSGCSERTTPSHLDRTTEHASEVRRHHWREPMSCGVSACYVLLRLKGHQIKYEDVASLIPLEEQGSNLSDIKRACECFGIETCVLETQPSEFDRLRWPAIVQVISQRDTSRAMAHFVTVVDVDDHFVYLINSSQSPTVVKSLRGDFFRSFTGYLLLPRDQLPPVSLWVDVLGLVLFLFFVVIALSWATIALKNPRSKDPVGCATALCIVLLFHPGCSKSGIDLSQSDSQPKCGFDLTAWSLDRDLGILPDTGEVTADFPIENTGSLDAELELGAPSCACSSVALDKRKLRPGEAAHLRMGLRRLPEKVGPISASVAVFALNQKWRIHSRSMAST